ncbi:aquaporin [Gloeopeniophorella convolvens]|nr:aquaporin [Gloeopeniophorella convolvens]
MTSKANSVGSSGKESPTHFEHAEYDSLHDYYTRFPNRWARIRDYIREPAAEMLGTMILILFGNGVDCQVVLGGSTKVAPAAKGDYLSLNMSWAVGAALGVWVAGGVSGGHNNPVVTLCLALFRGFPWKKVPLYMFGQLLGAFLGSLFTYANYFHAIDLFEGGKGVRTVPGTASLFSTYAADYMPASSCFFDEFLGAAILMIVVFAVTDQRNGPPPAGMLPLVIFFVVLGIGASFGMQTGYAINPARDLGPRIMTAMVGYGREVLALVPDPCPLSGGIVASFVYDTFIFVGSESFVNRPSATARRYLAQAKGSERPNPIAGPSPDDVV